MNLVLKLTILVNILAIIIFTVGYIFNFRPNIKPEHRSGVGFWMGILMVPYLLSITLCSILGLVKGIFFAPLLLVFVAIPFILGHYAKYETVKKYSLLQILSMIISLLCLIKFI